MSSAPALTLRSARLSDAARLCAFKRVALRETEYLLQGVEDWHDDVESERGFIDAFLQHERSLLLLALVDGGRGGPDVIGMCSVIGGPFLRNQHVGQLGMGVLRAHWRQGVGGALLEEAARWSEGRLTKLTLQVHVTNAPARALYARHGFVEEGLLRGEAMVKGAPADLIVMGRMLASWRDLV